MVRNVAVPEIRVNGAFSSHPRLIDTQAGSYFCKSPLGSAFSSYERAARVQACAFRLRV